ncbi:MAG: magnesium transporter CorA family protein [Candidatus Zixiibacteriota bacterium]
MQRQYRIENRKLMEVEDPQAQVVVLINPDEAVRKQLVEELKFDEHTLNSALDPDELSRLEFEPEHAALIFKRPSKYSAHEQFVFRVGSVGAFLFKERLYIVVSEDVPLFDGSQVTRATSLAGLILGLLHRSIIHFREHLKIINKISDDLQEKINRSMENRHLINQFGLQKSLVYYLNSLNSNGVVLEKLRNNAAKIGFTPEELELLDDTVIENNQCLKQADMYSNILVSLMDARASIVSNNLNVLMKTLNIITIAIMVPTFVVSAFSMNVSIPLQNHQLAFWMIMGLALASVGGFLTFWRIKKW